MNPVEECRRKAENMLQFFAMDASGQIAFLGGIPHDHGHPQFPQNKQVICFQRLVHNFLESNPALAASGGGGIRHRKRHAIFAQPRDCRTECNDTVV